MKRSSALVANAATQVKSLFISNITCGIRVVESLLFAQVQRWRCKGAKVKSLLVASNATFFSAVYVPVRSTLEKGLSSARNVATHAQQRAPSTGTYRPIPERSLSDVYALHLHVHNSKWPQETHRAHSREKAVTCDECNYCTIKTGDLKKHNHTHTGEKPYKCDQCNYSSIALKWLLWRGTSASTLESYKCVQCNISIRTSRCLRTHVRRKPNAPTTIAPKGWASVHPTWTSDFVSCVIVRSPNQSCSINLCGIWLQPTYYHDLGDGDDDDDDDARNIYLRNKYL